MKLELYSKNLKDTYYIANVFANELKKGDFVAFCGDLGAGKTTFIKEIANFFGIDRNNVTSTSFVIAREYEGRIPLIHADVYRLQSVEDLPLEIIEFINAKQGIVLMEWADNVGLDSDFNISLSQERLNERLIEIESDDKKRMQEISTNLGTYILRL